MNKIKLQGSYTVEAALILPIVMIIIISIIYYSFYLHDSLVMKSAGYSFVLDLNNYEGICEDELSEKAKEMLDKKTIIANNINASIELENNGMSIYYSGEFSFPFVGLKKVLNNSISKINRETRVKSILKSDFIRKCKVAKDAFNAD